ASDRERTAGGGADLHLAVAIAGPDRLGLVELVRALRGEPTAGRADGPLPAHAADLLTRELLPPAGAIGESGTPFAEGLRRLGS
nr:hypothetical protein [Euzebyaceae bacterium]